MSVQEIELYGGAQWQHCMFCGEIYHVNNGHFVPTRAISACEYCVLTHKPFTLEQYPILPAPAKDYDATVKAEGSACHKPMVEGPEGWGLVCPDTECSNGM